MKGNLICVITCYIMSAFGCDQPNSGVQLKAISDKSDIFQVKAEVIVKQDDDFSLYYTTDNTINFSKIKPIWKAVKGRDRAQQVRFKLPEGIHPTQLRIDLGRNPKQEDIYLTRITMSCKGKQLELPGTYIFSYFRPDFKKTSFDASSGLIRGIVTNGIRQSPSLYPKEVQLKKKIDLLTK